MNKIILLLCVLLSLTTGNAYAMIKPDVLYKSLELTAVSVEDDTDNTRASIAFVEYYPKYNINRYLVFTKTHERYIYCQQREVDWIGRNVNHVLRIGDRIFNIEYSKRVMTYCWVDSKRYENPIV